jgi:hypothetical protein
MGCHSCNTSRIPHTPRPHTHLLLLLLLLLLPRRGQFT